MRVCVVGGGAIGLAAAHFARAKGHDVTLFEPGPLGGLASSIPVGGEPLERFYHHFFLSDKDLLALIDELGLRGKLERHKVKMGFYREGRIAPFDTPRDLLRFPFLSLTARIRLGMMLLYFQRSPRWKHLDRVTAERWVRRYAGDEVWERFWKPLFYSKFTQRHEKIPAAWLWGRVHARGGSRKGKDEVLCYLAGSYQTFIDALVERLRADGVELVPAAVEKVLAGKVVADGKKYLADKTIFTASPAILAKVARLPSAYAERITSIPYQGIVCMILELKRKLSGHYWINNGDPDILFGGIIQHTNMVPSKRYGGRHVVYLFNYVPKEHPVYALTDKELFARYLSDLKRVFPDIKRQDVLAYHVNRAPYANPVFVTPFLPKMPTTKTPIEGLFLLNMTMIYPQDRNVSHSIGLAKRFVEENL